LRVLHMTSFAGSSSYRKLVKWLAL
jgi:hypothetical protein